MGELFKFGGVRTQTGKSLAFKKGSDFESSVYLTLKRTLRDTLIIHDVYVPPSKWNSSPAQIDILVVRGWSFWVLELKNYDKSLTAKLGDTRWIARSDVRSYQIQDPIMQSFTQRMKLIHALLELKDPKIPTQQMLDSRIIVPYSCRLNLDSAYLTKVMTLDKFIAEVQLDTWMNDYNKWNEQKYGSVKGDTNRLKEVLMAWKK